MYMLVAFLALLAFLGLFFGGAKCAENVECAREWWDFSLTVRVKSHKTSYTTSRIAFYDDLLSEQ